MKPSPRGRLERHPTVVSREKVVAPPDRAVTVGDDALIEYFKGTVGAGQAACIPLLHQLISSVAEHDFSELKRRLQADYEYFGAAAEARPGVALQPAAELDSRELRFLSDFTQLMEASQYRQLSQAEWDAAQAEDFLFTLPCDVKWGAMDTQMLQRYWAAYPAGRAAAPAETADRILVFQRGAEVAHMQGGYYMFKVNLLISMWILQPLVRLWAALMAALGVKGWGAGGAPKGLATVTRDQAALKAELQRAESRGLHPASTAIERRTFARVFPDGKSVLKQFFKQVRLQEACFRDLVVCYRTHVPDKPAPASEVEVIKEAEPKLLQRNIVIKQFRGIPLADLEMVMPEKTVFVPPKVFVEMAVTLLGGLVAVYATLSSAAKEGAVLAGAWTGLSLFAGRAMQVYTSALVQKNMIENAMGKLLYDRMVGSGEVVLTNTVEHMCRQRVREILVAYCVLLNSKKPLTADELDGACEELLTSQFGCSIDFCCEEALPAILKWGLATDAGGMLTPVPLPLALKALDGVFDNLYSFAGNAKTILSQADGAASAAAGAVSGAVGAAAAVGGAALGRVLSTKREPVTVTPLGGPSPADPGKKKGSLFKRISRPFLSSPSPSS